MEADTIPDLPKGSTARRIISHLVAPSASAASSCRRGVCMKISRDMEVIIGKIITASTTATVATVRDGLAAGPSNSGMKPRWLATQFQNG